MAAAATDLFMEVGNPGTATNLAGDGYTQGENSIQVDTTTNFPTATGVVFGIDRINIVNGENVRIPNSYCVFAGRVSGAGQISDLALLSGNAQDYAAGATTRVYITVSSQWVKRLIQGITAHANQDGSLKTAAVQAALSLGAGSLNGWNALGFSPNTVTSNGNHSYDLTFNGQDLTGIVSAGMRLRTTRTVAAPVQCASLNGTTHYLSKATPAGMVFTDDFAGGAYIKLTSYPTTNYGVIQSRYNGTSGWAMVIDTSGRLLLIGRNSGSVNYSQVMSYQAVPLNKWIHVAAQLDMSGFTASPTTSYTMFDGVDIPAIVSRGGTSPGNIIQAGNYEIGSENSGANLFPGKIAQVAIFNNKVAQATMRGYINQGLLGTETALISAYSFNNTLADLNTTNANTLSAVNGASATNADSPFGGQASGAISATLDYAIIEKAAFSANTVLTVQVPEGCTIPTTGTVSAVVYSSAGKPYGMPTQRSKWIIESILKMSVFIGGPSASVWYRGSNTDSWKLTIPAGNWKYGYNTPVYGDRGAAGAMQLQTTLSASTTTEDNRRLTGIAQSNSVTMLASDITKSDDISLATATVYNMLFMATSTSTSTIDLPGQLGNASIYAENAYL